jgi:hypothetical protein
MGDVSPDPQPEPQVGAIKDVTINATIGKAPDGVSYPILNIGIVINPGRAGEVMALLMQADAQAAAANQSTSGLVLPADLNALYLPAAPNGHGPRG